MGIGDRLRGRVRERLREKVRERIINSPLGAAITAGVAVAARNPATDITREDVPKVVREITDTIATRAPEQVNAEPWYQNRVKVGLYLMGFGALLKVFGIDFGLTDEDFANLTTAIVAFGAVIAAIGEWFARILSGIRWTSPLTIGIGLAGVAGMVAVVVWL